MGKGQLERSIAVAAAKSEIATRVRPFCQHLCDDEFDALVQRMAEIDVRYRLLCDWTVVGMGEHAVPSTLGR